MGDKAALSKARQELEALYLGIPDESVDLTLRDMTSFSLDDVQDRNLSFKNMAINVQQNDTAERKLPNMSPIREGPQENIKADMNSLDKSSSLDFSKALEGTKPLDRRVIEDELYRERLARSNAKKNGNALRPVTVENSLVYDDASVFSTLSPLGEKGRKRRPGIPHSNICALCSRYIYVFRHRCLACGRAYCRSCIAVGMGEMTEGRKCVDCLGRRFSQRYIQRAGQTGCCWRYSSAVKQQELIWAEKGPRRNGERRYGMSSIDPRSRSAVMIPGTPSKSYAIPGNPGRLSAANNTSPTSFVASSTFLPSPHNFPL